MNDFPPTSAATLTPYPGYWYETYPNYSQRLMAMATHVRQQLAPANSATSEVSNLALVPKAD